MERQTRLPFLSNTQYLRIQPQAEMLWLLEALSSHLLQYLCLAQLVVEWQMTCNPY